MISANNSGFDFVEEVQKLVGIPEEFFRRKDSLHTLLREYNTLELESLLSGIMMETWRAMHRVLTRPKTWKEKFLSFIGYPEKPDPQLARLNMLQEGVLALLKRTHVHSSLGLRLRIYPEENDQYKPRDDKRNALPEPTTEQAMDAAQQ